MPKLILLRHATAEPGRSDLPDHERVLTPSGRAEAEAVGRSLAALGETVDLVLCSTALRTRETAQIALAAMAASPSLRHLERLFDNSDYLGPIRAEGGEAECLLVVGHNPFIQDTAVSLAVGIPGDRAGPARGFPPAAFAIFTSDGAWTDARPGSMRLQRFVRPGD